MEDHGMIMWVCRRRFAVESSNKKKKIKRQCPFKARYSFIYIQILYY